MRSNRCSTGSLRELHPSSGATASVTLMVFGQARVESAGGAATPGWAASGARVASAPLASASKVTHPKAYLLDDIEKVSIVHRLDAGRASLEANPPLVNRLAKPLIPHQNPAGVLLNINSGVGRAVQAVGVFAGGAERGDGRSGGDSRLSFDKLAFLPDAGVGRTAGRLHERDAMTTSHYFPVVGSGIGSNVGHLGSPFWADPHPNPGFPGSLLSSTSCGRLLDGEDQHLSGRRPVRRDGD